MKKRSFFLLFFIFIISSVFFYGCGGGGPGSPGSDGSDKTGVIVDAQITPTYNGENTYSVDSFQAQCEEGPPPVYEFFTDHGAQFTFMARLVNPDTTFPPGNLYIEKYTIKYFRSTDSIGAPPIETDVRYVTMKIRPLPSGTGVSVDIYSGVFVDLVRKDKYLDDMLSGRYSSSLAYINNYTAVYKFEGKNDFGEKFTIEAQTDFQIGNFVNCS
jgi:hypothetical protein